MLEDNGRELGIDSKPFIARHVAERLDPADGAAGWTSVRAMTKAVWTLLGVDPPAS
jgi:hypothetical protein